MNRKLAEEVARKYDFLSILNPYHKLLKYFFIDKNGGFCMPEAYFEEFADRFKESSRATIRDFAINAIKESSTSDGGVNLENVIEKGSKYGAELFQITMRNYFYELSDEIDRIETGN